MSLSHVLVAGPLLRAITALITEPGVTSLMLWCLMLHQSPEREDQVGLHTCHWFCWTLSPANVEFVMGQRGWIGTKTVPLIPALP